MFVYGKNPIIEALKTDLPFEKLLVKSNIKEDEKVRYILEIAKKKNIQVETVSKEILDKYVKDNKHQGMILFIKSFRRIYRDLEEYIEYLFSRESKAYEFILFLDHIQDPMNLGAIIRSGVLFDFNTIILPREGSTNITSTVIKASAGGVFHASIIYVGSLSYAVEKLKKEAGAKVFGLDPDGKRTLKEIEWKKLAERYRFIGLVVGSEGKGLSESVKKKCDELLRIPSTNVLNSLNASVSAGIAMYEIYSNVLTK